MDQEGTMSKLLLNAKRRGAAPFFLAVLFVIISSLQTDKLVEAARPGSLAQLVPAGSLVLLEAEDLPALVGRWRDCQLRRSAQRTDTYDRCEASRLGLRLSERRMLLEAVLAQPLTIDRLASLPGNRGGLALYNVGETSFIFWLRTPHGSGGDLSVFQDTASVERRERGRQRYFVHYGTDNSSAVAYAVVGDLLIVSNSLEIFEPALSLAMGERGESLAGDGTYMSMAGRAPVDAQAHLYLDMARLLTTRQFRRYWVHANADELTGLDKVMLSVTFEEASATEHRILSYTDGACRMAAGSKAGASAADRIAALPRGIYSSLREADATAGAEAARWIWPDSTEESLASLRELLTRGKVSRMAEVFRLGIDRDEFTPRDRLALAYRLDAPEALNTEDVVKQGAAAVARTVDGLGSVQPSTRRETGRGVIVRTIPGLIPGWPGLTIARSRDGEVLIISSSTTLAREVGAAAAPATRFGRMIRTDGPDVARADFTVARGLLARRLEMITTSTYGDRRGMDLLLGESAPELLRVPQLSLIERSAQVVGDFDVQVVRYVY